VEGRRLERRRICIRRMCNRRRLRQPRHTRLGGSASPHTTHFGCRLRRPRCARCSSRCCPPPSVCGAAANPFV
jgi:hypothetical protein